MTGYIYCISNTVNDKLYVGKTLLSLEKRFKEHCRDARRRNKEHRPLYRAMNKYGIDKFSISPLEESETSLLESKEIFWIKKLNTYAYGYNGTIGGDGKVIYEEEVFNEDFLSGMNIREIAQKHNCDIDTVCKRLKAQGFQHDANRNNYCAIEVCQFDKNSNYLKTFKSYSDAARALQEAGITKSKRADIVSHISQVVKGTRKTAYGFIWKEASC